MIEDLLPAAILGSDSKATVISGVLHQAYVDGTVDVDLGGGVIANHCVVLATYTPVIGEMVEVIRRDDSRLLVLGPRSIASPSTIWVGRTVSIPFNVRAAAPAVANPFGVNPTVTKTWREADGWLAGDQPIQAAKTTGARGYYRGLYFYGNAFAALAGRTCTSLQIRLSRSASGGLAAAVPMYIAPHVHQSQPGGMPTFAEAAVLAGSLGQNANGTFTLPTVWGQRLIDGAYEGFGHLRLDYGDDYAEMKGISSDSQSGRVIVGWS